MTQDTGGISGSSSLRSPEALQASAHSGDDPGREGDMIWFGGALATARAELRRMDAALGGEPYGASRISIRATDLATLVATIDLLKGETA